MPRVIACWYAAIYPGNIRFFSIKTASARDKYGEEDMMRVLCFCFPHQSSPIINVDYSVLSRQHHDTTFASRVMYVTTSKLDPFVSPTGIAPSDCSFHRPIGKNSGSRGTMEWSEENNLKYCMFTGQPPLDCVREPIINGLLIDDANM